MIFLFVPTGFCDNFGFHFKTLKKSALKSGLVWFLVPKLEGSNRDANGGNRRNKTTARTAK